MDKKKTGLMLSILGVISLVLITAGVTYAFFNYAKEGTTDNVITTGSITFLYTEVSGVGNGISIENAFPTSDEVGKVATGEGEYFDFKITSETGNNAIPYEVTARKSTDSDNIDEYIRVYLTKGVTNEEVLLDNYNNLTQTSKVSVDTYTEKTIYTDTVPANTDYEETFRLRMWLDKDADFSDGSMNNKTFTLTVNVYANAEVVSGTDTTKYQAYSIGDAVTATDGSKWHVLEASDETSETVVLLSDYNLNSDGSYNTECSDVSCSAMSFDTNGTNVYDETDSNNIGYFIKNTYAPKVVSSLPGTTNVTLPTAYQIATADGQTFDVSNLNWFEPSTSAVVWLFYTTYWTKTSGTTGVIGMEDFGGGEWCFSDSAANNSVYFGARPVITTPKTNLIAE